jgi:biotin carboxyl carrier protein
MVLLARHGERLPKPTRYVRHNASVEARMNATNQALQPHAGGVIKKWSNPIKGEIRDDQGISMHNPDTDMFMEYRLAGAYDSNVALLLSVGKDRLSTYESMSEILRRTILQGVDLQTNLEFHYGLVNWFIGNNINARPTTRFIVPYLTAVGLLKQKSNQVDLDYAFNRISNSLLSQVKEDKTVKAALQVALERKRSLLLRPIEKLFDQPHLFSGWLSLHKDSFDIKDGQIVWLENPIKLLADTYHFLNMEYKKRAPAAYVIWSHDNELLQNALAFYSSLEEKLNTCDFTEIEALLKNDKAQNGIDQEQWDAARAAHAGYQAGSEIFNLIPFITEQTRFFDLCVNEDLTINIPDELTDKTLQEEMAKVLVPPPVAKSNEILAESGGMYYPREAPGMDTFVKEGDHFNQGDPLYIVEVMKMFNKVYAPFSGTIEKILVEGDGVIISKGQTIFTISPDEKIVIETPEEIKARKQAYTDNFLESVM